MRRAGRLVSKVAGLKTTFQGDEHAYVRCTLADTTDPERHFECRILDEEDIPFETGDLITLEVIRVVTERQSGIVRFDCHLIQTEEQGEKP